MNEVNPLFFLPELPIRNLRQNGMVFDAKPKTKGWL